MPKRHAPTPEPVPVNVVCSLCGEAWSLHAEIDGEVSTLECIRLLKAKAIRYVPQPYPVYPYVQPYRWPNGVGWTYTTTTPVINNTAGAVCSSALMPAMVNTANATEQRTPTIALASSS